MILTFPRDILADFPGTSVRFECVPQIQADPTRSGRQITSDLGPALWEATYQSKRLKPNELKAWKARLLSLQGQTFIAYDKTACFPIRYPKGGWPTGESFDGIASLSIVSMDSRTVTLAGLPDGYTVSVGDYLSFAYGDAQALHQAMESATAGGAGTAAFEVRPEIRPGHGAEDSPAPDVALVKPHAVMVLVPGSVNSDSDLSGRGTVSFSGRQTI